MGNVGLNSATPYPYQVSELHEWMTSRHAGDELRTAEALLAHCADRLMVVRRVVQDKHSSARTEAAPYYLDDRGIWEENTTVLKVGVATLLLRLKAESWALPPATPHVGGNAIRSQLKRLADKPDKVISHIPTAAFLAKQERASSWWDKVTFASERDLDARDGYLGTATGVVDLASGQLLTPAAARRHLVTRTTPVEFRADATHPDIENLTGHLPSDIEEYLWAFCGRSLWGDPPKAFYVIKSPPDSGKTSFFGAVGRALRSDSGPFSSDLVRPTRKGEGKAGPTPERAPLVEKRLIWGPEAEDWQYSAGKLKAFAGAEDEIPHQPKFRAEDSYKVRATMVFLTNEYPPIPLDDEAVASRARIIDYKKPTVEDKTLIHRVREKSQREAMLAKLVRYAAAYPVGSVITIPGPVQERTKARIAAAKGPFGVWLASTFVHAPGAKVSAQAVWVAWADNNDADPELREIGGVQRSALARKVSRLTGAETRPLWIDGRTQRGYADYELARALCSVCKSLLPSTELLLDEGDKWGAVCRSCRGEDQDGTSAGAVTGEDAQGGLAGMPTGHPGDGLQAMYLQEMVDHRRVYFAAQEIMFDNPRAGTAALESIPSMSRVSLRPQPIGAMSSADAWKRGAARLARLSAALSLGAPVAIDAPTLTALGCKTPAMLQGLVDELAVGTIPADAQSFQTFTANLRAAVAAANMGRGWRDSLQDTERTSQQAAGSPELPACRTRG